MNNKNRIIAMPVACFLRVITLILAVFCATGASAAGRYTVSADGLEVTDSQTGLIWKRCPEGTSGTVCGGTPALLTWQQALQLGAGGWHLPNVKELASLVDRTIAYPGPTIDSTAFPATSITAFWSSSPYAGNANGAWLVVFDYGYVTYYDRYVPSAVRLVRAGQ